jgi:hypothetical protein
MISIDFRRIARLGAAALLFLMVQVVWLPRSACAGCNHLVTSQLAREQLSLLVEPLIGDPAAHSVPFPAPAAPRPCLGVWCSGQPAPPSVPPGVFDHGRFESWAWSRSIPDSDSVASFVLFGDASSPRPVRQGNDVFHPPRLIPSA